jgi:hypothetical protein
MGSIMRVPVALRVYDGAFGNCQLNIAGNRIFRYLVPIVGSDTEIRNGRAEGC